MWGNFFLNTLQGAARVAWMFQVLLFVLIVRSTLNLDLQIVLVMSLNHEYHLLFNLLTATTFLQAKQLSACNWDSVLQKIFSNGMKKCITIIIEKMTPMIERHK